MGRSFRSREDPLQLVCWDCIKLYQMQSAQVDAGDWVATKMMGNATTDIGTRIVPLCHRSIATSSSIRNAACIMYYHATIAINGSTFTFGIDGFILTATTITVARLFYRDDHAPHHRVSSEVLLSATSDVQQAVLEQFRPKREGSAGESGRSRGWGWGRGGGGLQSDGACCSLCFRIYSHNL